ncbi:flavodoxin [Caldisalinibacter kiritimatiensis]|uniref:Flavodoxin n=1 Tax=Caldisalinibacter kiritimatiensis TaxID=1304284 RepID=R1CV87_9FIRM|nr:flavodoxin [Caldisalinibacter kiritimatiensis]EOD00544.1 Flavodoxin [Caldisalinibacter kiritimatiensis]
MESKSIVIYYSLEGNTKFISEILAKEYKADLLEIKPKKEIPTSGVMKYIIGGFRALFKTNPKLKLYNLSLDEYSTIFIGTPVWEKSMSPPIRTFLKNNNIKNKNIGLFCTCAVGKGKTFYHMKKYLNDNNLIDEIEFVKPLQNKSHCEKIIKEWIEKI